MTTPINLSIPERRKFPRRAVSQVVKLELESGVPSNHPVLLVTDMSDGGARLFAQNVEVPKSFALVFSDSGIRRECRMVWQIGPEVGIEFVEKAAARPPSARGKAAKRVALVQTPARRRAKSSERERRAEA
jgi:hypothetical protein